MMRILLAILVLAGALAAAGATLAAQADDAYLAGYAAAVLEREFKVTAPSLRVENGVITLDATDLATVDQNAVVATLSTIRGIVRVNLRGAAATAPPPPTTDAGSTPPGPLKIVKEIQTGLLPGGLLFNPLIADPRWPHFSIAYHYYFDDPELQDVGAVSFGETFTLYRDKIGGGWWEVGLQASVFSIFDMAAPSLDLINADYFVAIPLAYRIGDFSALFRLFHQSSHLGDEVVLSSRVKDRVNLSYEGLDLKLSWEFLDAFRVYGGGGWLFDRDPSNLEPWSLQYGAEWVSPWPSLDSAWRPVAAVDFQNRQENNWNVDFSARAGIQIEGVLPTRKLQLLLEYFRGNSPNGQFYIDKVDYLGLGAHFHF